MSNDSSVLKFKFLKNQILSFPNGRPYFIPMRQIELGPDRNQGVTSKLDNNRAAVVPVFDLEKIHEYPLEEETYDLEDADGAPSERVKKELEDDLYLAAREARAENDKTRKWFYHYVKQGVLEIVHDPVTRPVKVGKKMTTMADLARKAKVA
jgi:hypothetical protein